MLSTLREAGFSAHTTVAEVAKRTGLGVDEVKARAGIDAGSTTLGDVALDKTFAFPDAFQAQAGSANGTDLAAHNGGSITSSGLGKGNSGAGGLLRLQLDAALASHSKRPAHRGTEVRNLKEQILANVRTLNDARALARALGDTRGQVGGRSLDAFARHLAQWLIARSGPGKLDEFLVAGAPPAWVDKPAVLADLPVDVTKFPHKGAWQGALADAIVTGGVDTFEKVMELAQRLGMSSRVHDIAPRYAVSNLLQDMIARYGESAAGPHIAEAVKAPIAGITLPATVTIDPAVVPADGSAFPHKGAYLGGVRNALIKAGVDTVDVARALSARLGIGDRVGADSAEDHLFETLQALQTQHGDDLARVSSALKAALATPLDTRPAPDGLPPFVDASAIKAATTRSELLKAMLSIATTPEQLEEIAVRLDISQLIVGATSTSPRNYASAIIEHLSRGKTDGVASAAASIAAALE